MTIGSTVSSFALFRARKRDLTDEGSEAWASCRQTDRQLEMVGHVHVVLGLALPAGAILAEYKVVRQLRVHWVYVSSTQSCVFVVSHSFKCWYYSAYRFSTAAPKHLWNVLRMYGGTQLFAMIVVIIMGLQAGRSRVRFPLVSLEFFIDLILPTHYGPEIESVSNRNEYQEYFLGGKGGQCIRLATLSSSCADCLEIWEPHPPGILRACLGL